ncbi:MAG: malonyl-CoA decarboxylase [Candidatus Aminicenantes bacterium]|jgi:malonyl-CoA decarboxylase
MSKILKAWEKVKGLTRRAVTGKISPDLSGGDEDRIKKKISKCVFAKGGQISYRSRAIELGEIYLNLSKKGREKFMKLLAREFDIDKQKINESIQKFQKSGDEDMRIQAEMELSKALIPPRVTLLKQFNSLPDGFKFLIDFRADLLPIRSSDPFLEKLDADLKDLLSSWFDVGLLDLKEITWQSPASLLEKLIKYEAVHEIKSWTDLKNRLASDRECFAFFHNKIPDEPLIFVEVALVSQISTNIQELLDEEATTIKREEADIAIFYSISNAQKGLEGINLGNFLIKRVVTALSKKLKGLKHFITLSPIPNFREWLDPFLLKGDESILTPTEIKTLKSFTDNQNAANGLLELLRSNWKENPEISKTLKPILMRLCAYYLIHVKRGENGKAFDPVANFHLVNGAHIERLNWLGDTSEKGMKQSAGIMANYHYKLSEIEKNHELYITESRINAAPDVKKWIKKF